MQYININELKIDENQPRKTFKDEEINNLSLSMLELGKILQPIIIDKNNKIIDGERRYRAAKIANITDIPCYVINDIPDTQIELVQLIANSNRSDLSGLELAQSIKNILDLGVVNKKDIAHLLNKQPSYVSRLISMLSDEWLPIVQQGIITSPNTLEALKALPKEQQDKLIEKAKQNGKPIKHKDIVKLNQEIKPDVISEIPTNTKKLKVKKSDMHKLIEYIKDDDSIEIILPNATADKLINTFEFLK